MLGNAQKCSKTNGRGSQYKDTDSSDDYVSGNRNYCVYAGGAEHDGRNVADIKTGFVFI